jgi:DNA-binding LacI/PurR family transcriptional regulator
MRRRLVTINVVAAEAGVSTSTVSRVLNGRAGKVGISASLCERVHAAAERLHYAPNHAAQSLARQRTGIIALLLWRLSGSLCADIATGITTIANRHGYQVSVIDAGAVDDQVEARALRHLWSGTCDGVVVASGSSRHRERDIDVLTYLVDNGVTATLVLDRSPDSAVPVIDIDNAGGTYLATKHLLGLGHRRIAHITLAGPALTPDDPHPPGARYRGYLSALEETGVDADPSWVLRGGPASEGGRDMAHALVERFPDRARRPMAVVAFNDEIAIGVLRGLYEAGIRVPDEVALVGFGGTLAARFTTPALTTVGHPRVELGELAAEALFALIEGGEIKPRELVVPVSLVIRESCGAPPRRDDRHVVFTPA